MEQVVSVMQPDAENTTMEVSDDSNNIVLPEHELQLVLGYLPVKDLKLARQVCKQWAIVGGSLLAKQSRIFMKTDESYRTLARIGFEAFLKAAADTGTSKFMRFRDIELYHVHPRDQSIVSMLKSPCVKDSITSLRIHGPQLKWMVPVLPDLPTLKVLGFDDTHYYSWSPERVEMDDGIDMFFGSDAEESVATCGLETLEVHINGPVARNPLNWLLPMSPVLKYIKLVIVNTNQLSHCVSVFNDRYIGPGLKGLRISGSFGYNWTNDSGEKVPDREGARALSTFLACPGLQGLKSLAIHAPCYPAEWRDKILNPAVVRSLVSLEMDVYLRIDQRDIIQQNTCLSVSMKKSPRNPEPDDFLSAFPREKDGTTMHNLVTLKIDVDVRGSDVHVESGSFMVLRTSRIFPSLIELDIEVRVLRYLPVDITSCFGRAFPSLNILSVAMSSSCYIRPLLLNLPRGLKTLKVRSTTAAGKYTNFPRTYEIVHPHNSHRISDNELVDGDILSHFPELTELFIDFDCSRLTDKAAFEGFLKMPQLKKLSLGGPPEFSANALQVLEGKGITFTSAWKEEY